ncbi:hypothetical protein FQN54_003046 [Arachnomyces sp. PD_36]|nr:hypothetical protein FQN54_003046 [Arachnomyces sp. PD_36]
MSVDAGGLAQMTYNNSFNGGALGVPGSGFASRGKAAHIKRLSVPQPQKIDENQNSATVSTPRTSRSHLLAGLRTAPKTGTPSTAPLQQRSARNSVEHSKYGPSAGTPTYGGGRVPQTATGTGFPNHMYNGGNPNNNNMNMGRQMYCLPEHVLAPPSIDLGIGEGDEPIDEKLYAELVSTNLFLAEQQQRLQQQLASVTAAAQQFQGLQLNQAANGMQQQYQSPGRPSAGYYQQQLLQGMQPVVQPVPGQPGIFSVYNPMTGQQTFVMDNSIQQEEIPPPMYQDYAQQSPAVQTPIFRAEVSPPPELSESPVQSQRSNSPPKAAPSPPQDVTPLPPPSANAFRRNHKKNPSGVPGIKTSGDNIRGNGPKSAGFPATPQTGTFGPGQGRAGEHPIRQPRGPPSLEELVAKPTSKHEGSKNFATRQRRRAVHNLVRAGIERRGESRSSGHNSTGGSATPASETEFTFSASDNDDPATRSGSLSSKPSLGSLRAAASGAIGSERKEKDRGSVDSLYSPADEGLAGKLNEIRLDDAATAAGISGHRSTGSSVVGGASGAQGQGQGSERRPMPMRFLSGNAEKRKNPIM